MIQSFCKLWNDPYIGEFFQIWFLVHAISILLILWNAVYLWKKK